VGNRRPVNQAIWIRFFKPKEKQEMTTLAEIRKKLLEQETKLAGGQRDNSLFPFWKTPLDKISRVRFLPDGDASNTFFWVERRMIKIDFKGVLGHPEHNKMVFLKVPCMEMWKGHACPILTEIRPWWKDKNLEPLAKKYWAKKDYFMHGFVRDSTVPEENTPENPIRRFLVNGQIYPNIVAVIKDPEVEEMPTDYDRGLDFNFKATANGQYSSFTTSSWSRKESALTAAERLAIETYGLPDLKSYLPKKPSDEEVVMFKEMFEASVDGKPYDVERWGSFYNPLSRNGSTDEDSETPSMPVAKVFKAATVPSEEAVKDRDEVVEDETPFVPSTEKKSPKAEELLQMIRARKTS
jgi:hypothetical protein